jgi:cytochrome c-type biogenesis protein CcmE
MTRKHKRLAWIGGGVALLALATAFTLSALRDNLVFFYSPSELYAQNAPHGKLMRIGGLVEDGSVQREADGKTVDFQVSDGRDSVPVKYTGDLPDLFREGQGVVCEGVLQGDGVFRASNVLAKHDARYMPPEVADALKKQGLWRPDDGSAPAGSATDEPPK